MKVLIMGGTGVLSSAIASRLIREGHEVTALTDGKGHLPPPCGLKNHLVVDRRDAAGLQRAIRSVEVAQWDLVVDAVGYDDRQAASLLDIIGESANHTIVISTGFVYSRHGTLPLRPDSPIGTDVELGGYAAAKVRMEKVWLEAWKQKRHPVTILRPAHILGHGCDLGAVPLHNRDPFLLSRLLARQSLLLADGGRQVFQVVFAEDLALVIAKAAGRVNVFGKVYNCMSPEILTGRGYFEIIAEVLRVPLVIKSVPSELVWKSGWGWSLSAISRLYDTDNLMAEVGYVPDTPAKMAIEASLPYLQKHLKDQVCPPEDYLGRIARALDQSDSVVLKELVEGTRQRTQTPIDIRMNVGPTPLLA